MAAEVEPCAGVFAGGFALIFLDRVAVPCREGLKGLLEFCGEVERVTRGRAAESARGRRAGNSVVTDDFDLVAIVFAPYGRER